MAELDRLVSVLERARGMEETEFMIDKNRLCAALETLTTTTADPRQRRFKMAFFLLLPGAMEAYDALLARIPEKPSL